MTLLRTPIRSVSRALDNASELDASKGRGRGKGWTQGEVARAILAYLATEDAEDATSRTKQQVWMATYEKFKGPVEEFPDPRSDEDEYNSELVVPRDEDGQLASVRAEDTLKRKYAEVRPLLQRWKEAVTAVDGHRPTGNAVSLTLFSPQSRFPPPPLSLPRSLLNRVAESSTRPNTECCQLLLPLHLRKKR